MPCGGHHVYVIELADEVIERNKFLKENPHYDNAKRMACFYVGSTRHTVRCRYNQHVQFGDPDMEGFDCACFSEPTFRYFRGRHPKGKTRGNRFVGQYHKYLRGRMFKHENPFETKEAAEQREEALAQELRAKGYGVWQN
tara:strand:+ start:377 stop:796 length:420 start_codon:yes stop_codon:yes gene_type:complete